QGHQRGTKQLLRALNSTIDGFRLHRILSFGTFGLRVFDNRRAGPSCLAQTPQKMNIMFENRRLSILNMPFTGGKSRMKSHRPIDQPGRASLLSVMLTATAITV